jgi:hypothetical protein
MADEVRKNWNTIIEYMEDLAAVMDQKLENAPVAAVA